MKIAAPYIHYQGFLAETMGCLKLLAALHSEHKMI